MRLSNSYFFTLRENVKDEESISGNLLTRAGYIKKTSSGIYMYLPLGLKVLKNIENIIREEMINSGSQEVMMPALVNEDYYINSGRRDLIGDSMFSLQDRFNRNYVLGPTHEELFALAATLKINSYKDMPFNLFQFQNKFRDEIRPRFGLIRVREFLMKDAYSFDTDEAGLDVSYKKMYDAYIRAFDRMNIKYKIVKADTGIMGGILSEEFQATTDIGEDTVVLCDKCDLSTNLEIAECVEKEFEKEEHKTHELVETIGTKNIKEVANLLKQPTEKFVKTLIYNIDGKLFACLINGSQELNETKLRKLMSASSISIADNSDIAKHNDLAIGYLGPIGLNLPIIADQNILKMHNFITGANQENYHYINTNIENFEISNVGDITNIQEKDQCPKCDGKITFSKGIEIGNTFKLGTKYSQAMNLTYTNTDNLIKDVWMGSYGIGLGRCLAALVEQNHDENGIVWPKEVAPYQLAIVLISDKDPQQVEAAEQLYSDLSKQGYTVLFDDRSERPGIKFKDLELIGIPTRIVVGKHISNNKVEIRHRNETENKLIDISELKDYLS